MHILFNINMFFWGLFYIFSTYLLSFVPPHAKILLSKYAKMGLKISGKTKVVVCLGKKFSVVLGAVFVWCLRNKPFFNTYVLPKVCAHTCSFPQCSQFKSSLKFVPTITFKYCNWVVLFPFTVRY